MPTQNSWFTASEIIEIWIGIATTVSAVVAVLSYRFLKGGFFLSLPHVEARNNDAHHPNFVWLGLAGNHAEQWQIQYVTIKSPRSAAFLQLLLEADDYGGGSYKTGGPIGRTQPFKWGVPLALSSVEQPVKLRIKISLKAFPNVTSWRMAHIGKRD